MNLSLLFARRYFRSRKSHSVINTVSRISSFALGIPVAAMVILLSVFNGFEDLVKSMYGEFDPDIAIYPSKGTVFEVREFPLERLQSVDGIAAYSFVLEQEALLGYRGSQTISTVRGVDSLYAQVLTPDHLTVEGEYRLMFGDMPQAYIGQGIAYQLGIRLALYDPIRIMVPRRGNYSSLIPVDAFREGHVYPGGIFALDADTDGKYVIVPLSLARELWGYPDGASAVMVKCHQGYSQAKVAEAVSRVLGDDYRVLTRYQQKATLYRIMTYEKWGIFTIILMVMIIASFSLTGSLVMLIIEKKNDIRTLFNIGGTVSFVRAVYIKEGMLISLVGAFAGLVLGLLLCFLQQWFGIIKIPAETFLVSSYPVLVRPWDIVAVIAAFFSVSLIITNFTVRRMIPRSEIML